MSVKRWDSVIAVLLLMLTIILFLSQKNVVALPPGWSDDIRLTDNINSSTIPVIGVWENYVHVFWCEREPEPPTSTRDIYYKRSFDGGNTWDNPINLIDSPYDSIWPSIAFNQSTIHMVWTDDRLGGSAIFYTRSDDNGTTWIPEVNISTPNGGTVFPDIAVWGEKIFVIYFDGTYDDVGAPGEQLYLIKSEDKGDTWSVPKRITSKIRDSAYPRIAVNDSNVHVVWRDHYDKNGQSTAGAIFYMNSTDDGLTWSEDINLTEMDLDAAYPYITVNGSTIHVVYSKEIAGLWQGYYRRSEDNGITWTEDVKIVDPPNDFHIESFAMENSKLYVVGREIYISDEEIYFVKSIDNGQSWGDDVRLTYYPEDSQAANIAVYNNTLHVVWQDYRDGNGSPEIYYKQYPVYADLSISLDDITFSDNIPNIGITTQINATIQNIGDENASATIEFWDGDPDNGGVFINSTDVTVNITETVNATINWIPITNGTHNIYVKITNTLETNLSNNIANKSVLVNREPELSKIPSTYTLSEDSIENLLINLSEYVNDDLDSWDELTFSVISYSNSSIASVSIFDEHFLSVDALTGSANDNWTGTIEIVIEVIDSLGLTNVSNQFIVTVTGVNDPPEVLNPIPNFSIEEDTSDSTTVNLTNVFFDSDNSSLHYTCSGNTNISVIIHKNGSVTFIPLENWTGDETITFYATDNLTSSVSDSVTITLTPVNDAPVVINTISDFIIDEDTLDNSTVDLDDVFYDVDNATLYYSYSGGNNISVIINGNGSVTFIPAENWSGIETITFYATDNLTAPISEDVTITVIPINDPPVVINLISDFNMFEDTTNSTAVNLNDVFYDVDNTTLHYYYSGNVNINVIIDQDGSVTFSPLENWTGIETITFYATDNLTNLISEDVTITVIPINDPPVVINLISDFNMFEDTINSTAVDLTDVFFDCDNTSLYYYSEHTNINVIIHDDGTATFIPLKNWTGSETVIFYATDNLSIPISEDVTITVIPINDPPVVINPISDFSMFEDTTNATAVNLGNVFYDVDNTTLYYYHSGNVNINVIIDQDGSVTFSPLENWTGIETITFYATDNLTDPISEDVTITVIPINDPPVVINLISDFNMFEDTTNSTAVDLDHVFFDCDNTSLYYYSEHTNINVIIHDDGTATFIPLENWTGSETITIYATDNLSLPISEDVTVTVIPINDPPIIAVLSPSNNSNHVTSDTIYFNITVLDIDSDTFTYLWDFGDGTTSTTKNATHQFPEAGIYNVSITVSDGSASDMRIVTIVVEPVTVDGDENGFDILSFLLILMAIIIVVILLLFLVWRRRIKGKKDEEQG